MDLAIKISKEYGKGYLSYSSIKLALEDMRLFEMKMRDQLKYDSPALSFGKLYDCMLLTPENFEDQFITINDEKICEEIGGKAPKRTKAYAEWMETLDHEGKTIASKEDMKKAEEMIVRLKTTGVHEIALKGDKQHEFNDFIGDVPVRGFLDVLGDGYITDSKTTQKLGKFKWSIREFGYDIQAYMYSEVLGTKDFRWVVQEKAYPYAVGLYYASQDTLDFGKFKFDKAVNRITEFLDSGMKHDEYYHTETI